MILSSVTFAMRKQLQAEHGKEELEKEIKEQQDERQRQQNKVIEIKLRIEAQKMRNAERYANDTAKREEEKKFFFVNSCVLLQSNIAQLSPNNV